MEESRLESQSEIDSLTIRLKQAQEGSPEALGQLLEDCRKYLLKIASGDLSPELRAKAGASDVVQETLLEAQRDLAQFTGRGEDELLAWLRRILLNNLANIRRQYQQTSKRDVGREVSLDADGSSEVAVAQRIESRERTPGSAVIFNEKCERVAEVISGLPDHMRQVLEMRHRDNKSFAEIGAALGRSAGAARKLWVRAVDRLQQELGE